MTARFDSPVELPYGMTPEGARGQLKAAVTEAIPLIGHAPHASLTVAGLIRCLAVRVRSLTPLPPDPK